MSQLVIEIGESGSATQPSWELKYRKAEAQHSQMETAAELHLSSLTLLRL